MARRRLYAQQGGWLNRVEERIKEPIPEQYASDIGSVFLSKKTCP